MNRSILILCIVLFFAVSAFAQIPNAGFETWASGSPTGWMATNAPPVYTTITQVSTAHSGSSAARGEVVTISGSVTMAPIMQVGSAGDGFAFTQRPASLTGWYRFSPASGSTDQFLVTVTLMKSGTVQTAVAAGAIKPVAASSYTQFTVPLTYVQTIAPDICFIQFALTPPSGSPKVGSYFIVDDLAFSSSSTGVAGDAATVPGEFILEQNYPNPFNPSTTVSYQLSAVSDVKLTITNTLGQAVATLVNDTQAAGRYTVRWDAAGQTSGLYFYRLQAGEYLETKKMVLLR
jgi:hypothetical protein